jgi:SNF2 family DNA or RNA helicase
MPSHKYFPKWEPMTLKQDGFDAIGEIQAKIQEKALYADVDKFLPGENFIRVNVGMTAEQAKAYKEMKDDLVAQVQSGVCSVNLAITKALRLMQIASGFLSIDDDPEKELSEVKHEFKNTPKQEMLAELLTQIRESGEKVLVWAVWKHNYEQIKKVCDDLKFKYVEVHGGISQADKEKNINIFNTDPDVGVYIGHPRSGGIGLNLTVATYSIFYSRNFSLEHWEQAKRRNFRGGQTKQVTHYSLVTEGTIDEKAVLALGDKQEMSDRLIRDIILGL